MINITVRECVKSMWRVSVPGTMDTTGCETMSGVVNDTLLITGSLTSLARSRQLRSTWLQ